MIARLGADAYVRELKTLRRWPHKSRDWAVVALDTEYTQQGDLVCWQIADAQGGRLIDARDQLLTPEALAEACANELDGSKDVVVVCYWSLAELQHLPVFAEALKVREYARGSLDCTFETERANLHIFDIARFYDRLSLRKAAAALGLEKAAYDVRDVTFANLEDPEFRHYSIVDAEITRELFVRTREAWQSEGVEILRTRTPAACSAARFRGVYLDGDLGVPRGEVRRLALRGCWGGRAEAFARGSWSMVYEYDLSSAYPSAAIEIGVIPRASDWRALRSLTDLERARGGFVRVSFRFPDDQLFPCLPVWADGTLLYPRSGESWCTTYEASLARALGADVKLYDGWVFYGGDDGLARMMRETRARRAACEDAALKIALKLQMNAAIGKFIQHRATPGAADVETVARGLGVPIEALGGLSAAELIALGWKPACRIGSAWAPEVNGLITGFVRAQLSRMIADTDPIYCATDAVWTTHELASVPEGWELKRAGQAIVARTRLGRLDGKVVHHAWSVRSEAGLALERGEAARRYVHRRPLHFVQALREERRVGEWIEQERLGTTRWDNKRELLLDGASRPWENVNSWRSAVEDDSDGERKCG